MTLASPRVIFIEDDDALRVGASQALELEGFAVTAFADAASALPAIDADFPGVIVSDIRLPGMDGIELFARLREIDPELQVIFTTAHGDVDMAVDAMKNGAADFFPKPYAIARLALSITRAMGRRALELENRKLRAELRDQHPMGVFGQSAAARRLEAISREVARTDADLLLSGPPGTGKSFLARQIHDFSSRSQRPLVVVDPGIFANAEADLLLYGRDPSVALSRSGMIERAHGGTLVLDAIEQIPREARARLVSLIDTRSFLALGANKPREVDIRVIATSAEVDESGGDADQDSHALRYRLSGITIPVPSLIDRREDIPEIFRRFVGEFEQSLGREAPPVGESDWHHLLTHRWPGNLRELHTYAQGFVLGLTGLAAPAPPPAGQAKLKDMLAQFEKTILENALIEARGNIGKVQAGLSIPRKTLYDKFRKHGIQPKRFRAG